MGKKLINDIIDFFQEFKQYENISKKEIQFQLKPSIQLNQFKLFQDQKIYGFVNWAFLNEIQKTKFLNHAIIDDTNWKCGHNLCFANFVCSKNIRDMINWCKDYFGGELKYDNALWVKAFKNNRIMRYNNKWEK